MKIGKWKEMNVIILLKIHNKGVIAVSRNVGIREAKGEWILKRKTLRKPLIGQFKIDTLGIWVLSFCRSAIAHVHVAFEWNIRWMSVTVSITLPFIWSSYLRWLRPKALPTSRASTGWVIRPLHVNWRSSISAPKTLFNTQHPSTEQYSAPQLSSKSGYQTLPRGSRPDAKHSVASLASSWLPH